MRVSVAYALPERQSVVNLEMDPGATVALAIQHSGLLRRYPEIDLARQAVGVWGRVRSLTTELKEGDRVEIYRPRQADPKAARRRRAGA